MEKMKRKKRNILTVAAILMVLFALGIYAKLSTAIIEEPDTPLAAATPVAIDQLIKTTSNIKSIENCDFAFENWISGNYTGGSGKYKTDTKQLCLSQYMKINSSSYQVKMSDTYFLMYVAEFDKDGKYLGENYLVNGMKYTPKSGTKYIGLGIYNYKSGRTMNYSLYKELFNKGNVFKIISNDPIVIEEPKQEEEKQEEPEQEEVLIVTPTYSSAAPAPAPVVKTAEELCREELKQMIITGDMSTHKIKDYKINFRDAFAIWEDLKNDECYLYAGADALFIMMDWGSDKNITEVYIYGMDDDFLNRHDRMMKVIDELCSKVDDKMTDLDKILLVHEYLVKNTTYSKTCLHPGTASAVLGNKTGMCSGFAQAMTVVLKQMGVKSYSVIASKMNHGWNYVEVDGEVYHIDNCWDNTKQTKSTGQNWHRYLLRTDAEMKTISPTHYGFYCDDDKSLTSTSTKFSNWFVHDVYGEMFYYDGLWYYYDKPSNSIKSSDAYGKTQTTLIQGGSSTLKLTKVEKGVISYTLAGASKTQTIK